MDPRQPPAILAMLRPVTNPAYPQLSFFYHIDFGLMRVLNHHDNTEVPRAEWPSFRHPAPAHLPTPPATHSNPIAGSSTDVLPPASLPAAFHKAPAPHPSAAPSAAPNDDAFAAADAEPRIVVAPPLAPPPTPPLSPSSSPSPPPATLAPFPTPSHLLTATALDTFVAEHPDFRASPLQLVTLDDPYVLATTQPDPQTIIDNVLPQAGLVEEGSIWDLAESPLPTAATWTTQLNLAHTPDIQGWIDRYPLDPWRGALAVVLHSTTAHFRNMPHRAYLPLQQGQVVTLLSRPFWNWTDRRLLAGTHVVACSPYTPPQPARPATAPPALLDAPPSPTPTTSTAPIIIQSEEPTLALLGLAPLCAFLP